MILLPLLGCHVFETVAIDCASDEPCARPKDTDADADTDADTDTDTDTDTDADTDVDTGPIRAPTLGWVISGESAAGDRVIAYAANGGTVAAWTGLGELNGAVGFDPASGDAFLGTPSGVYHLAADGTVTAGPPVFGEIRDLAVVDGGVYVVNGANVFGWNPSTGAVAEAFTDVRDGVGAVAPAPDGGVFVLDTTGGPPDLVRWEASGAPTTLYTDFDTSAARSRIVFAGPDGAPHTCSSAGGIYAVAGLAEGATRPVAYYAGGLTDVGACAYDPGDGSWLLFSPTAGVVRMDAESRAEIVFEPVTSYTPVRASFY